MNAFPPYKYVPSGPGGTSVDRFRWKPPVVATNRLYYGDNLDVLREHVASEFIDLVYLDPPFNSNRALHDPRLPVRDARQGRPA